LHIRFLYEHVSGCPSTLYKLIDNILNDNSNITVSENNALGVLSMIARSVGVEATTEAKTVSIAPREYAMAV
jgi:hypothetical protein